MNGTINTEFTNRESFKVPGSIAECPILAILVQGMTGPYLSFLQVWRDGATGNIMRRRGNLDPGARFEAIDWKSETMASNLPAQDAVNQMVAIWINALDMDNYKLLFSSEETFANQLYGFKAKVTQPIQPSQNVQPQPAQSNQPTAAGSLLNSGARRSLIGDLNENYKLADKLDLETMGQILKDSSLAYWNSVEDPEYMLDDDIYDYVKELYRVRMFAEKQIDVSANVSGPTGMEDVPKPVGRMSKLPVWMGSLSKMQHGDGKIDLWKPSYPGPYVLSAKMDGASALRFWENGLEKLYSRGKDGSGQDLSELLPYLQLPPLPQGVMVRGELILKKSDFEAKYKKKDRHDKKDKGYKSSRNAVGGGLVNKIGSRVPGSKSAQADLDIPFMDDVKFIVYEAITTPMAKCSDQFAYLNSVYGPNADGTEKKHCGVAPSFVVDNIDDAVLSTLHDKWMVELDYEIDGVVICSDRQYERAYGENPGYARAYKKPLATLTGIATIVEIKWNLGKHAYLNPQIFYTPIPLPDGSTLTQASGYNARYILKNQLGPGAVVEIIRSNGIIPKIITFIKPAPGGAQMPTEVCYWNKTQVELVLDQTDPAAVDPAHIRAITIKQMKYFLKTIGVKGVAKAKLDAMYGIGVTTIPLLFAVRAEHIAFMGPKASENVINAIHAKVGKIPLPTLAAASGCFGRAIGNELCAIVFDAHPNILEYPAVQTNNVEQLTTGLLGLPNFGPERATTMANGFARFMTFLGQLRALGYPVVLRHQVAAPVAVVVQNHPLAGMKITLTGFHQDADINSFVPSVGGIIQAMKADTNMLIIKDDSYANNKTKAAEKKGVIIITRDEFKAKYIR